MSTLLIRNRRKVYKVSAGDKIDNISVAPAEREIVLRFTDSRTVVSEKGNVRLAGKQNMEGKVGDLLCLISDGTSWDETSRMVR